MEKQKDKKNITIFGISIDRILEYFIIYSILGFVLETVFAMIVYGKLESRQGFLYGPFCPIYGVGAVFMIVVLQKFKKSGYTLFAGGILVGSIVEYAISIFGELILNVRWWDYSDRFLNINGRICLLYSVYWGIIAIYLMKSLNPQIDRFLDFITSKVGTNTMKILTNATTIFLFINCIVSAVAINTLLSRTVVENNLQAQHKDQYERTYEYFYNNESRKEFVDKFWNEEKIIKTYPNLRLTMEDGSVVYVQDYYRHVQPYYYKFK